MIILCRHCGQRLGHCTEDDAPESVACFVCGVSDAPVLIEDD